MSACTGILHYICPIVNNDDFKMSNIGPIHMKAFESELDRFTSTRELTESFCSLLYYFFADVENAPWWVSMVTDVIRRSFPSSSLFVILDTPVFKNIFTREHVSCTDASLHF